MTTGPTTKPSFEATTEFLYSLEKFGIKMNLDNIEALMKYAGDVHRRLNVIHVAGTNGKGSTCAMIASVLMSEGYRVGLYTSPHIISFTERIKINGRKIGEGELVELTDFFRDEILRLRATFFEATTAIMFKFFADSDVDFAVIETGLGGRLDATNVVDPLVSVITGIGLDHTETLGDTLEKIALEKAGIMKPNRPAVVNVTANSVREVFARVGGDRASNVFFVDDVASCESGEVGIDSSTFDAVVFGERYDSLKIDLGGKHQMSNALTALSTLNLPGNVGVKVSRESIYRGFSAIRANTGHRGRLEVISREPLVILDVAHNPDGIRAVLESLAPIAAKKNGTLLMGAMKDKDSVSMLNSLRERFSRIILTQLQIGRSLGVDDLKKLSDRIKLHTQIFDNSTEALRAAISQTDNDSFLLITGSHYLAGEILPVMEKSVMNFESQ